MIVPSRNSVIPELSTDQQRILWIVAETGEATSYSLSNMEDIGMDSSRASQLLKTLLRRGMLRMRKEISQVPPNREKHIYSITDHGLKVHQAYMQAYKYINGAA